MIKLTLTQIEVAAVLAGDIQRLLACPPVKEDVQVQGPWIRFHVSPHIYKYELDKQIAAKRKELADLGIEMVEG